MNGLFRVIQPGLLSTVQNLGHPGLQRYGIAPGGAADATSLRIANALVRNPATSPALEITLTGPTLEAVVDVTIAITGADMSVTVDGHPLTHYHSVRVSAGSRVVFGRRRNGARAYLAVDGGLASAEGNVRIGKGEILVRNGEPGGQGRSLIHLSESEVPIFESPALLRVLEGPHWHLLSMTAQAAFVEQDYTVDLDSNRVGIRLSGPTLGFAEGQSADILSEPTPIGTIQAPLSGQPIILMTDRPITGGYAKVATVISADIPGAAQLAPADAVHFQMVSLAEAHAVLKRDQTQLRLLETLATW